MPRFIAQYATRTDADEQFYDLADVVIKYFDEYPDELFVDIMIEDNDETKRYGRVTNPNLFDMVSELNWVIDTYKRKHFIPTIQIRNK